FTQITQIASIFYEDFKRTLKFTIKNYLENKIAMEIRTTVHTALLQEDDVNEIISTIDDLGYSGVFYIQNFRNDSGSNLANLGEQTRLLDRDKILKPKNFSLDYRNFF
ncbi:MAG: hypothetical protein LBB13_00970, partial [Rickettsiales bacterium]|nr:hypothetical protein [Rickettsiales bacterium]